MRLSWTLAYVVLAVVCFASPALAVWGVSEWGSMVWGAAAVAVPGLELAGLALLVAVLLSVAAWKLRHRSVVTSLLLVGPTLRRSSGFTLIELMIVIAMIAIIAAIAIPKLIEARRTGNESAAIGSLRTINDAWEIFQETNNSTTSPTLDELFISGYLDNVLGGGAKQGYNFRLDPGSSAISYTAVPAVASAGSRNFRLDCGSCCALPLVCTIHQSSSGLPDSTSPVVPATEGDPADPVPPTSPTSGCVASPFGFTPTTPALQAASDAEVEMFFKSMAVAVVDSFGSSLDSLTFNLFANAPSAPVAPDQAVLGSLDLDKNGELSLDELAPAPGAAPFPGATVIAGVLDAYGSCSNACVAAGETSTSCATTCSEFAAPDADVVSILEGAVSALPSILSIGVSCEEDLPSLPLAAFSGDPLAFISAAFGIAPSVPTLAPPLLGVLVVILSAAGLRHSRKADRSIKLRSRDRN